MTKTPYTKGPWEHGDNGLVYGQVSGEDDEAPFVCDVIADKERAGAGIRTSEEEANARLIATAPELLEAVEALVECEWSQPADLEACQKNARAVIVKVRGKNAELAA
jgi:hypothetical protein